MSHGLQVPPARSETPEVTVRLRPVTSTCVCSVPYASSSVPLSDPEASDAPRGGAEHHHAASAAHSTAPRSLASTPSQPSPKTSTAARHRAPFLPCRAPFPPASLPCPRTPLSDSSRQGLSCRLGGLSTSAAAAAAAALVAGDEDRGVAGRLDFVLDLGVRISRLLLPPPAE